MQLIALDDFNDPFAGGGGSLGGTRALIAAIGKNTLDERKQGTGAGVEHRGDTVAILNIGRVNRNAQQKTERIDKDVPLAAGDLLARIVTLRVHRGPPFCAVLALWLSMIAALGLASRPARSRTAT